MYTHIYVHIQVYVNEPYVHSNWPTRAHACTRARTYTHTHVGGEREGAKESSVCVWHTVWMCVETLKRKKREIEDLRRILREPQTYILFYV